MARRFILLFTRTMEGKFSFTLETFIILLVTISIIIGNILVLLVTWRTCSFRNINRYFLTSLTLADLMVGVFITPFSFWTSLFDTWIYGMKFCHIEAYFTALFWIVSLYSLMCISIDHHFAIRKPGRYNTTFSQMRCMCWIVLIWLASLSFCVPMLFGNDRGKYSSPSYICIVDWTLQKLYFVTSGVVIVMPATITLTYTNLYIFTHAYKKRKEEYEKYISWGRSSRPKHYFMAFIIGVVYLVSWIPWCTFEIYDHFNHQVHSKVVFPRELHFYLLWLAVGNSFYKFVIYLAMSAEFREGLSVLFYGVKNICHKEDAIDDL